MANLSETSCNEPTKSIIHYKRATLKNIKETCENLSNLFNQLIATDDTSSYFKKIVETIDNSDLNFSFQVNKAVHDCFMEDENELEVENIVKKKVEEEKNIFDMKKEGFKKFLNVLEKKGEKEDF